MADALAVEIGSLIEQALQHIATEMLRGHHGRILCDEVVQGAYATLSYPDGKDTVG